MKDQELRVKIAEACGWKKIGKKGFGSDVIVGCSPSDPTWPFTQLPDYLNDLNAMHEAEKSRWTGNLEKLFNDVGLNREWYAYKSILEYNIHATARQRAEAFVRALNI